MVKPWVSSRPRAQSSFEVSQREPSIWPWSVVRDFFEISSHSQSPPRGVLIRETFKFCVFTPFYREKCTKTVRSTKEDSILLEGEKIATEKISDSRNRALGDHHFTAVFTLFFLFSGIE